MDKQKVLGSLNALPLLAKLEILEGVIPSFSDEQVGKLGSDVESWKNQIGHQPNLVGEIFSFEARQHGSCVLLTDDHENVEIGESLIAIQTACGGGALVLRFSSTAPCTFFIILGIKGERSFINSPTKTVVLTEWTEGLFIGSAEFGEEELEKVTSKSRVYLLKK